MTPKRLAEFHRRFRDKTPGWDEGDRFRLAVRILLDQKIGPRWQEFAREYLRWDLGIRRRPLVLDAPPLPSQE
jgi:hypothetical protein